MNILGLAFVILAAAAMVGFNIIGRRRGRNLRDIPAFYRLGGAIELAVEDGTRVHVSIGRGDITSPRSAAAFVGLSMLRRVATVASDSDQPPLATAGDGALALLAQDTLRGTYNSIGASANYDNRLGRAAGLTPFSYAAATIPVIRDEHVSTNLLIGSFGTELALITDAGDRSRTLTLAGTDSIPAQAILYATAHEPLIGEEVFAGGAYVGAGPMHVASLHAQDALRWLVALALILGAFGKLIGILP